MQFSRLTLVISGDSVSKSTSVTCLPSDLFRQLLMAALRQKGDFDEGYYLANNQDIKEAISRSDIADAAEHYYTAGYFEGRSPKRILVDERFYVQENPDVAAAIKKGLIGSAQEHFENTGFGEGRLPFKGFSLF
jgi:hypothetical protein